MRPDPELLPRDDERDEDLACAYIEFEHAEPRSDRWNALFWTHYRMGYLIKHLPQRGLRIIRRIWSLHECPRIEGNLSHYLLPSLLRKHGRFIAASVEAAGHADPEFAKLLAAVPQDRTTQEQWLRFQRILDGSSAEVTGSNHGAEALVDNSSGPGEQDSDEELARATITFMHLERSNTEDYQALFWTHKRAGYLTNYLPHKAFRLILLIWSMDQSTQTMQNLSAGMLEDLLAAHGEEMIPLVEAEAKRDPTFAKLLGGAWKNRMSDEVWERVQKVWDRRGWDGIPES